MTAAPPQARREYLNVGCGHRFSRDARWRNIDLFSTAPGVEPVDVARGLPFPAETFAAVYHSHVLEHFAPEAGARLLGECWRVLQPGGVLRVVVPDLEQIARAYLARLEEARLGQTGAGRRHRWAVLELCDQMLRSTPGGEMRAFLADPEPAGRAYAVERCGAEVTGLLRQLDTPPPASASAARPRGLRPLLRSVRARALAFLLRQDEPAFREGQFRHSGEVHRWMYDEYSLGQALAGAGFTDVTRRRAIESGIEGWVDFALDADATGASLKPDSLFLEARKPPAGAHFP